MTPLLLKLGPVKTGEGPVFLYPLLAETRQDIVSARDDDAALAEAIRRTGGQRLSVERSLRAAAERQGIPVREPSRQERVVKALLALGLEHQGLLPAVEVPLLLELLDAAVRYQRAKPWESVEPDVPLSLRVTGAGSHTYEAAVLGGDGDTFGLALYDEPGSVRSVVQNVELDELDGAAAHRSLACLIGEEPEWVAQAVEDAVGLPIVPLVLRMERGDPVQPTPAQLSALVAALNAVAAFAESGGRAGKGECAQAPRSRAEVQGAPAKEKAAPAQWDRVGRNDPCPCGSGQKYKKCHGAAGKTSLAGAPSKSGWHEVDARLVEELGERVEQAQGKAWQQAAAGELYGQRQPWVGLVLPWALYEREVDGASAGERLLAEKGGSLSRVERLWLEAQRAARWDVWEVLEVDRARGTLEALGLRTGERVRIRDVGASAALDFRDAVLGRIVRPQGEEEALFAGTHPTPLPPDEADRALARAEGKAGPRELLEAWDHEVSALALKAASPMVVQNTDGHPVLFVEDAFEIARGREDEVRGALLALEGAELDDEERRRWSVTFTRPGNAVHGGWTATVIGGAVADGGRLTLSANSLERADALRARVEAAAGGALRHRKRKKTAPPERRGGETVMLDAQPAEAAAAANPEVAMRSLLRRWVDDPLPSLGGQTPRAAVEDEAGRRQVHLLLKGMEHRQDRRPAPGGMDPSPLRAELGLDVLGGRSPHHALELALGAGRKLSETLIDFASPLIGRATDFAALQRALEVAVPVWNAVTGAQAAERPATLVEVQRALRVEKVAKATLAGVDLPALIDRKRQRFGPDRRSVGRWGLRPQAGGGKAVWMEAVVPSELHEKAVQAGIGPPGP